MAWRSGSLRIDLLASQGDLDEYHLLHAARADLLRRVGSKTEAAESYKRALEFVTNDSERRFLERRLAEVTGDRDFNWTINTAKR